MSKSGHIKNQSFMNHIQKLNEQNISNLCVYELTTKYRSSIFNVWFIKIMTQQSRFSE